MWNLVAEHADERLTSLLLASYDEEASYDQLIGYFGLVDVACLYSFDSENFFLLPSSEYRKMPEEQSERVGKVLEKTHPHLALIFYAKANCPDALFGVSTKSLPLQYDVLKIIFVLQR